ncbi:hypothetical protein C10C_0392 [Chlamydia serpentis]|uniref:Double zinc ribbon domain-containing protein n=1 Tax=Chlamydia serpentis TaxID=1967782 RepID=A0A2R8FB34_9CHLA|nr:hypothetical protein [Chlamydia serpentis]SPN73561.1 hypothetical protein C10C_0392 [Chlamydia serpentis]
MLFSSLLFPKLCYGCHTPGAYFCSNCLQKLVIENREKPCTHCFHNLCVSEINSCHFRTCNLYFFSKTALSIYSYACAGKWRAIQFFSKRIASELASLDNMPTCIVYIVSTISREIVTEVAKLEKLSMISLWPCYPKKRQIKQLPKGNKICFLSKYPLSQQWFQAILEEFSSPVVSISLFLPPDCQ